MRLPVSEGQASLDDMQADAREKMVGYADVKGGKISVLKLLDGGLCGRGQPLLAPAVGLRHRLALGQDYHLLLVKPIRVDSMRVKFLRLEMVWLTTTWLLAPYLRQKIQTNYGVMLE
jgi:hypothetical protein